MPASSKCSTCNVDFDCEAHFPLNCPCGKYSVCEKCSIESVGCWASYCCRSSHFERDATFSKFVEKMEVRRMRVECGDCRALDDERKFSICRTCTKEQTKIDILNCDALSEAKLRYFAICQHCVKDYHEGHELVDYFPILASINHQTQVMATSIIQSKLDKASEEIRGKMENMLKSLEEAKKVANEMTENVRIAKSSRNQKVLSDLITECYANIRFDTEETTLQLKELPELHFIGNHLEELKEKHKKMEMEELKNSNSTERVGRFEVGTDAPKCLESDGQKMPGVQNVIPMHLMNILKEQQRSQQSFKTGTDVPKCPENDGQKQSGVQNGPAVDLGNILQDNENLIDSLEHDLRCMNHFKNEEKRKFQNLKFNQGFGGLTADNGALESTRVIFEPLTAVSKTQSSSGFDPLTNSLDQSIRQFWNELQRPVDFSDHTMQ